MSWNQDGNKLGVKYLPTSILKKLEIDKTKTHNCVNAGYVETSYSKFWYYKRICINTKFLP